MDPKNTPNLPFGKCMFSNVSVFSNYRRFIIFSGTHPEHLFRAGGLKALLRDA
jgi:hypothetical protein